MPNQHTEAQYSKEDCIEALQQAADELGRSPTQEEYRSLDISPSSAWPFIDRFGSWNNAKDEAGLEVYFERKDVPEILNMSNDEWWNLTKCQRTRLKKRAEVAEYKLSQGCYKCGYSDHPQALDFHHINKENKSFDIGQKTALKPYNEIKEEIDKCRVVCATCHRVMDSKYGWC